MTDTLADAAPTLTQAAMLENAPSPDYLDAVAKNLDVSQRIGRATYHPATPTKAAMLENAEVIERWFDWPSIVGPLLLVMASFTLAGVVIVLIAGGS